MNKYLAPIAELISFSATDVILTSFEEEDGPPLDSGTDLGGTTKAANAGNTPTA